MAGARRKLTSGKYGRKSPRTGPAAHECSEAMSRWKSTGHQTPEVAAILGKCRVLAGKIKSGDIVPGTGSTDKSRKAAEAKASLRKKLFGGEVKPPAKDAEGTAPAPQQKAGTHAGKPPVVPEKSPLSEKAIRAQQSYKKANKEEQRYAEAQEAILVTRIGGYQSDDNRPLDVIVPQKKGKPLMGVECKTLVSNGNDKVTMKRSAIELKEAWADEHNATIHSVIMDHRDRFNEGEFKELYSGHELYYKRGVGSFRVGSMHKAQDAEDLLRLMKMPEDELPPAARPSGGRSRKKTT